MWRDKTVSVVMPTYNEKDSIRTAILDFRGSGFVDEVVVVNNNAAAGTDEEARAGGAVLVHEARQGYGHAIRRGLREATGDYVVVAEPDGTFTGRDVVKLLAYAEDCDVVYGTRTHREFIWAGANMGRFLKWGNYFVAKLMEFSFNTSNLSDVGCTMRLLSRRALLEMEPHFTIGGSAFGVEMMLISVVRGLHVVQVPVNYTRRVGRSSVTGDPVKSVALGLWMIWLIVDHRLRSALGVHPALPGAPHRARSPRA
jgi:glycosyltransferase involved in cell wall biosynthesis